MRRYCWNQAHQDLLPQLPALWSQHAKTKPYLSFTFRCVFAVVSEWWRASIVLAVSLIALTALLGVSRRPFSSVCSISMSLKISIHFFTACISPQLFRTGCDTQCRKRRTDDGFNVAPFYESWRLTESVSTDGAYLAYTQGDAHENPKPEKGGGRRSGEEKTVRGG